MICTLPGVWHCLDAVPGLAPNGVGLAAADAVGAAAPETKSDVRYFFGFA